MLKINMANAVIKILSVLISQFYFQVDLSYYQKYSCLSTQNNNLIYNLLFILIPKPLAWEQPFANEIPESELRRLKICDFIFFPRQCYSPSPLLINDLNTFLYRYAIY